ncbi:MAG: hypothetical protein WDM89_11545 [Rhizomicrobium sp.]
MPIRQFALLRRFGSVTVLNGHIHRSCARSKAISRSTPRARPPIRRPAAGDGPGPGPLKVDAALQPKMLGITTVGFAPHPASATLTDYTIA